MRIKSLKNISGKGSLAFIICLILFMPLYGQDDPLQLIEKKQRELKEREDNLKKEEERLKALERDIDEKIERYSKLLSQFEDLLRAIKGNREKRLEKVVKTYEAMPPEEAAARVSELDEDTATKILSMMNPKKASAIMAAMEPKKVATLTIGILKREKKFPTR